MLDSFFDYAKKITHLSVTTRHFGAVADKLSWQYVLCLFILYHLETMIFRLWLLQEEKEAQAGLGASSSALAPKCHVVIGRQALFLAQSKKELSLNCSLSN
jgi:hypothetical protein